MRKYLNFITILAVLVLLVKNGESTPSVQELTEENWELILKDEWMVKFFAPWCPACKNLAPVWGKFAATAENFNVKVAQVDVTTSPSLSGRFFVTALPTIYHVINGEFRQYRGSRDLDALTVFVQKKDWKKIEPISKWKKPDSLHMTVLSYFFKLSHMLKEFNTRFQEEYGLPSWASYALFAVGTIFVGAVLGLLLVCIVDFLFPPKKTTRQSFSESKEHFKDATEDLAIDEIEDDNDDNDNEDEDECDSTGESIDAEVSSSEAEKNSQSESEQPESEKDKQQESKVEEEKKSGAAEVRKRKPRKAD